MHPKVPQSAQQARLRQRKGYKLVQRPLLSAGLTTTPTSQHAARLTRRTRRRFDAIEPRWWAHGPVVSREEDGVGHPRGAQAVVGCTAAVVVVLLVVLVTRGRPGGLMPLRKS